MWLDLGVYVPHTSHELTGGNANQGLLRRALRNESHEGEMSDTYFVFY
jgi:hypothetical protein